MLKDFLRVEQSGAGDSCASRTSCASLFLGVWFPIVCLQLFPHQVLLKLRVSVASLGLSHISQRFPGQQMEEKVVNKREHTRGINQYVEARRDQTGPAAPF